MTRREQRPRVLHVLLAMGVGGAEKLAYEMVRALPSKGFEPLVCCLQLFGPLGEALRDEGVPVYFRERIPGVDLGLIRWLRDIMRRERIDIVHAHNFTPLFFSVIASLFLPGIKIIYTEHGRLHPDTRKWKRYLFNPLLFQKVGQLVSISEMNRKAMMEIDNLPSRIRVIRNGVPMDVPPVDRDAKRKELGLEPSWRFVGTAARLEEIKNIPMMLKAFKQVARLFPEVRLLIAGTGPAEDDLKELARQLGIGDNVIFLGLRFDLPEIYPLFEVFLLASFTEGISLTLLESMLAGVPSVVTDVGGNPEVVVEGVTGCLVPLDDETVMAEKIVELLGNPSLSLRLGKNGQERVRRQFSFDAMMNAYCALYRDEHDIREETALTVECRVDRS